MTTGKDKRAWSRWPRNVRLFLIFRVFFNARYYYPIFALLFLDLGLTLAQFAVLNALWAVVIVALEVPSGAMADLFGRRKLLRLAAMLMVVEMLCLLIPRFAPDLLLLAMAVNRICSGAAEAMASGADEALAYDSLGAEHKGIWASVLEVQMRFSNLAMMVAMLVGAAVYDPALWRRFLSSETSDKVAGVAPIVLTLVHAMVVVAAVMRMEEVEPENRPKGRNALGAAFRQTRDTVLWLLGQPKVRLVILSAVLFDHLVRQGLVVSSDYLNAIGIPKAYLGLLGALSALASSCFATPLAKLGRRYRPVTLFWIVYAALMVVSLGLAHPVAGWSAAWVVALSMLASAVGYLTSLYLNQLADPARRATVLSVKGLVINVGYGWISLAYGIWVASLPTNGSTPPVITAFGAYLPYASVLVLLVVLLSRGKPEVKGQPGGYPSTESTLGPAQG
jgi:hypothetical protein